MFDLIREQGCLELLLEQHLKTGLEAVIDMLSAARGKVKMVPPSGHFNWHVLFADCDCLMTDPWPTPATVLLPMKPRAAWAPAPKLPPI